MLWLAGLLCIAGIGAASIVSIPADQDTADADDEPDAENFPALEPNTDLLDQLDTIAAGDAAESAWPAQPNRLDVLNNIRSAGAARLGSSGEVSQNIVERADPEIGALDETAHPLSLIGRNVDENSDHWVLEGVGGIETDEQIALPTTEGDQATETLGDWIMRGAPSEVLDYQHTRESLMLVWDDLETDAKEPEVAVESDPFDEEVKHVLMNGKSVAEIYGDPNMTVADVTVIPLSSALIVGLEPEPA